MDRRFLYISILTLGAWWAPTVALAQGRGGERRYASLALERRVSDGPLCFSAQSLRDHVNAQLGYDVFSGRAKDQALSLFVEVARTEDNGRWEATLRSLRPGEPGRERTLSSAQCDDLLDAIVFSLTLVIDPVRATSGASPSSVEHAVRLLDVARDRASRVSLIAKAQDMTGEALLTARSSARQPMPVIPKISHEFAPVSVAEREVVSAPVDAGELAARDWMVGVVGRRGALPTGELMVRVGLRRVRGWRVLEAFWESAVPNIYPSFDGEVRLSTHQLGGAACLMPHAEQGSYLGLCARLQGGVFRGRGEGFDTSQVAHGVLMAPGASVKVGLNLARSRRVFAELEAGWSRSLTSARWIVQGERVAQSSPNLFSVGISFVRRDAIEEAR